MNHLPADWKIDRLKDVALINGFSLPANTDPDYEFDYLEISNVNYYGVIDVNAIEWLRYENAPSRARRRVGKNSTIISSVRPNLQSVAFLDGRSNLVCSTGFNVVQAHEKTLHPKFVYYALVSEGCRQYFEATAKGVGYPAVDDKDFNSFPIPLPPLPEQERIVAYLDASCAAIDAAVAAKRRQIDTLDALRKSTITRAVTRGLDPGVRLAASGHDWLAEIPEHWTAPCLKRLLREPLTYGLNEAAELEDRDLPRYLRITDFDDSGTLRDDTFRSLPREIAREALLEANDVLFARSGATVGKTFMFRDYEGEACFAGYLIRARTMPWKLNPLFLYHFTKTTAYEAWKNLVFTQATIQNISALKYNYLAIPLPPLSEQQSICNFVERKNSEFRQLSTQIERQVETLVAYRKSLIHECVTGQRRISEEDLNRVKAHG
ncbi:MAG: restriction endonuclease subunit S [Candidatus Tectomicrobia bacterium]|uniref:Restriction endonuclease subunit S n=1 Tax=Tectimicrobiota bacterium TaxID=2528274 RepID=A0A932CQY7_UNCTE|nr:restriction endonuclease subunit S [Candidatus Tectomicrobia bacterium]